MGIKSIALVATTLVLSSSVNAALISTDWQTAGDNLITQDTVSGLEWLDLTVTNNLSYDYVSGQFGTGGQFAGFRYATNSEVVQLWSNVGIDLSGGYDYGAYNTLVETAAFYFGDVANEASIGNHGLLGITSEGPTVDSKYMIGAYGQTALNTHYYGISSGATKSTTDSAMYFGSYLVAVNPVPVPAAAWLFGTGLIGLIGIARRKKL